MNLGELRTAVDRLTGIGMDTTAQTEWVNAAIQQIATERDWPWLESEATFNTASGTAQYNLPSDWRKTRALIVNGQPAAFVNVVQGDNYSSWTDAEAQWSYTIDSDQITLYPTPGGVFACTHRYVADEAELSLDASEPTLPARYHWAVIHLAASLAHQRMGDSVRASFHDQQYRQIYDRMVRTGGKVQGPINAQIRPGGM